MDAYQQDQGIMDAYQQDQGITVAYASDISCHSMCFGNTTNHTSSMSTFCCIYRNWFKVRLKDILD